MITVNFASRNYRLIGRIQAGLAALAVLLAVSGLLLFWTVLSLRTETAALDRKVKKLEAAEEQFKPLLAERDQVIRNLSAMSGLLESKGFSWTRLFYSLEQAFPVGVAVARVEYNSRDRMLALEGEARSPESLRNLVVGLERSAAFQDPYLKHQSLDKGSISFNVAAFYKQHQAAGVAQGK